MSPRTIFHSLSGTIGWRLFPRRWRGNRRGKILFNPNGFHGIEGIIIFLVFPQRYPIWRRTQRRLEPGTGTRRETWGRRHDVCDYLRDRNLTPACTLYLFPLPYIKTGWSQVTIWPKASHSNSNLSVMISISHRTHVVVLRVSFLFVSLFLFAVSQWYGHPA